MISFKNTIIYIPHRFLYIIINVQLVQVSWVKAKAGRFTKWVYVPGWLQWLLLSGKHIIRMFSNKCIMHTIEANPGCRINIMLSFLKLYNYISTHGASCLIGIYLCNTTLWLFHRCCSRYLLNMQPGWFLNCNISAFSQNTNSASTPFCLIAS